MPHTSSSDVYAVCFELELELELALELDDDSEIALTASIVAAYLLSSKS
jgi:hypothetical protein